jgi:hypothetical protein
MILSALNNQFYFNLPKYMLSKRLEDEFDKLMLKTMNPYDSVMDYVNSTIKEIVMPSITFNTVKQIKKFGKEIQYKEAKPIQDKFSNSINITFRATNSYENYFILLQIITEIYLDTDNTHMDFLYVDKLDTDGDIMYKIKFSEIIFNSLSEMPLAYNRTDISEKTFTLTFTYNYIDIDWQLDDVNGSRSILDV